jgi:hypothetical protein
MNALVLGLVTKNVKMSAGIASAIEYWTKLRLSTSRFEFLKSL